MGRQSRIEKLKTLTSRLIQIDINVHETKLPIGQGAKRFGNPPLMIFNKIEFLDITLYRFQRTDIFLPFFRSIHVMKIRTIHGGEV